MMMMMMMMCKRLAQVPKLCVPIYNMKLAMMQKTLIFTTFSAHTKMAADKRGQIEVFARMVTCCMGAGDFISSENPKKTNSGMVK